MQADLLFQLSSEEFEALRSQFATSNEDGTQIATGCGVRRYEPGIVTEHGAPMAATMLRSQRAVKLSIYLVPAFKQLRDALSTNPNVLKRPAGPRSGCPARQSY